MSAGPSHCISGHVPPAVTSRSHVPAVTSLQLCPRSHVPTVMSPQSRPYSNVPTATSLEYIPTVTSRSHVPAVTSQPYPRSRLSHILSHVSAMSSVTSQPYPRSRLSHVLSHVSAISSVTSQPYHQSRLSHILSHVSAMSSVTSQPYPLPSSIFRQSHPAVTSLQSRLSHISSVTLHSQSPRSPRDRLRARRRRSAIACPSAV